MKLNSHIRNLLICILLLLLAGIAVTVFWKSTPVPPSSQAASAVSPHTKKKAVRHKKKSVMRQPIDWRKSSETKPYPKVKKGMWLHVSLKKQRVYVMSADQHVLYTMYASTGVETPERKTPKGTYHIQAERGRYFYSPSEQEGAYYWGSWLHHGEYLFHSTPTDVNKKFIQSDAKDLGKKPSSHGCVHLSVADAKWVYENIPYGMKVVID